MSNENQQERLRDLARQIQRDHEKHTPFMSSDYVVFECCKRAACKMAREILAESSTQQAPKPRTDIDAVSRDVVKLMKDYGYVYSFEHNDINHLANQIVRLVRRQS